MTNTARAVISFAVIAALLVLVGVVQSASVALVILNLCLISAIMALGVNIQWGYAGLFNVGTMGFAALGGVAAVFVSAPPVAAAWSAGGINLFWAAVMLLLTIAVAVVLYRKLPKGSVRAVSITIVVFGGLLLTRQFSDPAVADIEAVNPAVTGYLGGLGMPILFAWIIGGVLAAGAAWLVGKISLGLRSDYLAIATLGISEIIIALLKNEDWLTRGVKNVTGLPRPVPLELDLQQADWFIQATAWLNAGSLDALAGPARETALRGLVVDYAGLFVKLNFTLLFAIVLLVILWLSVRALNSPWGRMMRAIRDNEVAANAMGKNVTGRHLQVFVLGSAVVGIAGAMLVTLDGQFTPGTYHPLRFTFLIWVMVIVGGSGNNLGSILGGFIIWFVWIEAEPVGVWLIDNGTAFLGDSHPVRLHLMDTAQHMRAFVMGLVLLLMLRFNPGGLLPEVRKTYSKSNS